MKRGLVFWVENYFYNPSLFQKLLSFTLLPLSWLYCLLIYIIYKTKTPQDLGVDVVGVGNLNIGGNGKTPLVCALAHSYEDVAIVLRGYGRESKGLVVVKDKTSILCDVDISGDEAMIYAHKLLDAIVIVSEDRKKGIKKAKELGAKIVFLDDAYSKHDIKKLDLLIDIEIENNFCLPSGAFRERIWSSKEVVLLKEGVDFKRVVELKDATSKMALVTAIAKPQRLDKYLPEVIEKNYFEDHHHYTKGELQAILDKSGAESLLVTYKDLVKIERFGFRLSLLDLEIDLDEKIFKIIGDYIAKKD